MAGKEGMKRCVKVFFLLQLDVQFHTFQSLLWMPSDGIGVVELLDALHETRQEHHDSTLLSRAPWIYR